MSKYFSGHIRLTAERAHILHEFDHKSFDVFAHFLFIESELIYELDIVETFEVILEYDYGKEQLILFQVELLFDEQTFGVKFLEQYKELVVLEFQGRKGLIEFGYFYDHIQDEFN